MSLLGVTGLPCSGKSLAAELIASGEIDGRKSLLLKADEIGHRILLRPDVMAQLRGRFGDGVCDCGSPAAMRKAIAERVFANPDDLEWLEKLIHPLVAEETTRETEAHGGERVVAEAALMFASGMEKRCDAVLVVEADFSVRLARAARRGWDKSELERREKRQLPLFEAAWNGAEKDKLARVVNNGSIEDLRENLRLVLAGLAPAS